MQYRMHPDIANVSRRLYARAGLSYVSAPSTLTDRSQTAEAAPAPGHSLIFCNTEPAHPVTVRDAKGSPFNLYHALLAVRLAQQALSTPGHLPTVSIICPYRAQVNLIERLLRLEELDELVRVGTIHRFQGRESDVVIFDTVTTENATRSMLGWAYDDAAPHKLINVALTRAKGKLIVIGHHGALATLQHGPQPILWECIEEAETNPVDPGQVRWLDNIGIWKQREHRGRVRWDLVQKDNGALRIYYGVTEEGIHDKWAILVGEES